MVQPKTAEPFQALWMNSYCSFRVKPSWIAATSIIRPWLESVDSLKSKSIFEKSGSLTVKFSTKSKLIKFSVCAYFNYLKYIVIYFYNIKQFYIKISCFYIVFKL